MSRRTQRINQFFLTNVKAMQAFQLLRQGSFIIGAILLPNLGVDQQVIGQFEQLLYIGYSLSFFWVAGLVQGLLSSYTDYAAQDRQRFLFNAYGFFTGMSSLVFILMLCFPGIVFAVFTKGQPLPYYYLFILYLLLNTPTFLLENLLLLKAEYRKIYFYGFFSFFAYLAALMLPLVLGYDFWYAITGLVVMALLKHFYLLLLVWQTGVLRLHFPLLKKWMVLSAPLILYAFLGGLMQTFDGWIINYWYEGDPEKFAVFRYGARELPLVLALSAAFGSAMLPEIRKDRKKALEAIRYKSLRLFHLLFPLSALLLAFSDYWFPFVFTSAFQESVILFDTYLIIVCSRLIFSRTVLIGMQDNRMVLYISVAELLINIGLSFYFIAHFGLFGVALATLLAFSLEKVFLCIYLWYRHGIPVRRYAHLAWWGTYSAIIVFLFLLKYAEEISLS